MSVPHQRTLANSSYLLDPQAESRIEQLSTGPGPPEGGPGRGPLRAGPLNASRLIVASGTSVSKPDEASWGMLAMRLWVVQMNMR